MELTERLFRWAKRRNEARLLRRYGGIQTCPWCRQCAQAESGWRYDPWDRDDMLDVLTCGVCGGTSLWRFELMMVFIASLRAPAPAFPNVDYYDIEAARLRVPRSPAHD